MKTRNLKIADIQAEIQRRKLIAKIQVEDKDNKDSERDEWISELAALSSLSEWITEKASEGVEA